MRMSNEEYAAFVDSLSPRSPIWGDLLRAGLVGGAICVVGQLFIDYTKLSPARILTGYVVAGVILSAVGLYKPLADFAGAGASVPLLGFGHLLAQGVQNAVDECGLPGAFTGGLTAASGGIAASLIFGVLSEESGADADPLSGADFRRQPAAGS